MSQSKEKVFQPCVTNISLDWISTHIVPFNHSPLSFDLIQSNDLGWSRSNTWLSFTICKINL